MYCSAEHDGTLRSSISHSAIYVGKAAKDYKEEDITKWWSVENTKKGVKAEDVRDLLDSTSNVYCRHCPSDDDPHRSRACARPILISVATISEESGMKEEHIVRTT